MTLTTTQTSLISRLPSSWSKKTIRQTRDRRMLNRALKSTSSKTLYKHDSLVCKRDHPHKRFSSTKFLQAAQFFLRLENRMGTCRCLVTRTMSKSRTTQSSNCSLLSQSTEINNRGIITNFMFHQTRVLSPTGATLLRPH